ncbi:MAG TPA: NAD(P)H-binding protein [Streptosporangiaceae bacterium]|jgi:uncharacterized protein YbjT (DUF2867 family)
MKRVLVTGGTGVLGREVVTRLAGADVRVLSRKENPRVPDGVTAVRGDLGTGDGLAAAVAKADVIVHAASNAGFGDAFADVASTGKLLDAARAAGGAPHLVYVSIVGVDRARYGYYRAKHAAERLVEESGLPWTVLRATQFHDLAYTIVALLARSPVVPVPVGFRADPVDVRDAADRVAALALAGPAGRAPDLGGPRTLTLRELARIYLDATGRRRLLLDVPVPGKAAADMRAGMNLLRPAHVPSERGERTFEDYVRDRVAADGGRSLPYSLKR